VINVTKTYLPNKEKYKQYVDEIYANGWITNSGPLVKKLEKRLAEYLGVRNIVLVANGTVALEIAYRTLDLKAMQLPRLFLLLQQQAHWLLMELNLSLLILMHKH